MRRLVIFAILLVSLRAYSQEIQTTTEHTSIMSKVLGDLTRNEDFTYSYKMVDGEKILDGPFTFIANGINGTKTYEKVTGQFADGYLDGTWTWTVKFTDISLPTYDKGKYLTLDAKMVRRYSHGAAHGEWECSYVAKRRDIHFDMTSRTYRPGEYIKSLEENYSQVASFDSNLLTMEMGGERIIDGVYYDDRFPELVIDDVDTTLTWDEYFKYAKHLNPNESGNIIPYKYNRGYYYLYTENVRLFIGELIGDPNILKTELLDGAENLFSPLWKLGKGFQTSSLLPVLYIQKIETGNKYDELEVQKYLAENSSTAFWNKYLDGDEFYNAENTEKLKAAYEQKKNEEEAELALKQLLANRINDYVKNNGTCNGDFAWVRPYDDNSYQNYRKANISFIDPNVPEDWVIPDRMFRHGTGHIKGVSYRYKNMISELKECQTMSEADSLILIIDAYKKKYGDLKLSIGQVTARLTQEEQNKNFIYLPPLSELINFKAVSPDVKKKYGEDNEGLAKYLLTTKSNSASAFYSVIYLAYEQLKNKIQIQNFKTEADYLDYYYTQQRKLSDFYKNNVKKVQKYKTPEQLLQAAGVSL